MVSDTSIPHLQSLTFDVMMKLIDRHSIFAITDEKGIITHANNEFIILSKYSREELIGNNHNIIKSDEHSEEFFSNMWSAISSGETWNGEIKNKAKDGSFYWLKTTISPMYNEQDKIIAYVSLRTDITEQKQQTEQSCKDKEEIQKQHDKLEDDHEKLEKQHSIIEEQNKRLKIKREKLEKQHELIEEQKELLEIKNLKLEAELLEKQKKSIQNERLLSIGLLASRMSHDIRNPLSIIRMSLENLKFTNKLDSQNINQFEKIERATQRMAHQIDNVLDYVKEQNPRKQKVSFSKIIRDVKDMVVIPRKVKLVVSENDIVLNVDEKLFSTALMNLIHNSIHAMNNQGTIIIAVVDIEDKIIIEVEDSGIGIPKEHLKNIFEPLYTTKQQGTGLGLSSVKSIIESHCGTISVTSTPTMFTITLPKN